ncbi:MAG: type VI secretion system ATPase TssH, partial [Novosphingobium sp.]
MSGITFETLFGRLNSTARKAIDSSVEFCKHRGNPTLELVHWLHLLLQNPQNDVAAVCTAFAIRDDILQRDVVAALDRLPRGAASISAISPLIGEAIQQSWVCASLQFGAGRVRTGHVLLGILKEDSLKNAMFSLSGEFRKIHAEKLADQFEAITAGSTEHTQHDAGRAAGGGEGGAVAPMAEGEALAKFSVDLTQAARDGKIDRIVGRDAEIRQVIDILLRRRQNNPILVGEAGVGKTAVVE